MFSLTLFSPSSVATTNRTPGNSIDSLPGALAAQVAFATKTPEAVIAEAQEIMTMPEPDQQQACLIAMGFEEDKADELLDAIAELQEQGIALIKYPSLNNVIDEMFHRLEVYAKIFKHGKNVNPEMLQEVAIRLSEETFQEWSIRDSDAEEFKDGNPVEFKTLNLTKIIKILNSVANNEFEPSLIASIALDFNLTK